MVEASDGIKAGLDLVMAKIATIGFTGYGGERVTRWMRYGF